MPFPAAFLDDLPVAWIAHSAGVVRAANAAAHEMFDVPPDEDVQGLSIFEFVHPESRPALHERMAELERTGGPTDIALARMRRRDGTDLWIESRAQLCVLDDQPVVQVLCWDVTSRVSAEAQLSRAASTDPLTGLANRLLLAARWERVTNEAARSGATPGLLFCDLDGFKTVNDRHGHLAGDQVLKVVAERLVHGVRPRDTVARTGGDEFVVLVPDLTPRAEVLLGQRLCRSVARRIVHDRGVVTLGISVGSARMQVPAEPLQAVLARADDRMYEQKRQRTALRP